MGTPYRISLQSTELLTLKGSDQNYKSIHNQGRIQESWKGETGKSVV